MDDYKKTTKLDRFLDLIRSISIKKKTEIFSCKCRKKNKIAEREFYMRREGKDWGTRLICMECGENHYIADKKNSPLVIEKGEITI